MTWTDSALIAGQTKETYVSLQAVGKKVQHTRQYHQFEVGVSALSHETKPSSARLDAVCPERLIMTGSSRSHIYFDRCFV